jgi:hypothetical protein
MHTYIHIHTYTHTHARIPKYTRTHTYIHTYYIHTPTNGQNGYINIYTHMCTYIHTSNMHRYYYKWPGSPVDRWDIRQEVRADWKV